MDIMDISIIAGIIIPIIGIGTGYHRYFKQRRDKKEIPPEKTANSISTSGANSPAFVASANDGSIVNIDNSTNTYNLEQPNKASSDKVSNSENNATEENIASTLKQAGFELSNVNVNDLKNGGLIIWPIVVRKRANLIHNCQVEVLRLLSGFDWKIKIIIANCGSTNILPEDESNFKKEIKNQLIRRDIENPDIVSLDEYYEVDFPDRGDILTNFIKISSNIKLNELKRFITKDEKYTQEQIDEIEKRSTLKFIQPILTWSATVYETNKYNQANTGKKVIVIAGRDEEKQWNHVFKEISTGIGGIFNPILTSSENGKDFNYCQGEEKPIYLSAESLIEDLEKGNLFEWLFKNFIILPACPNRPSSLDICNSCDKNHLDCSEIILSSSGEGDTVLLDRISKEKFVTKIWDIIQTH